MERSAEVIVIGAGVVGLAATWQLRERGIDVLCLEAHAEVGLEQSRGAARIFRHIHRDPELIELARQARADWRELEERSGLRLLGAQGQIILSERAEEHAELLRSHGVACDLIAPGKELPAGFPIRRPVGPALFDRGAGALLAQRTTAALAALCGESVQRNREIAAIEREPQGFALTDTEGVRWRCERLLIAAGARSAELGRWAGLEVPLVNEWHLRQTFSGGDQCWPCLRDETDELGGPAYGLPLLGGDYALALAGITANSKRREEQSQAQARLLDYASRALPQLRPTDRVILAQVSSIRGRRGDAFGIWRRDGAFCLAGGNLFKFAPTLGKRLAGELSA